MQKLRTERTKDSISNYHSYIFREGGGKNNIRNFPFKIKIYLYHNIPIINIYHNILIKIGEETYKIYSQFSTKFVVMINSFQNFHFCAFISYTKMRLSVVY